MIHANAVAALSSTLNNLINGGMAESQENRVVWEDVRVDTFLLFIQFAYQGQYTSPSHTIDEDQSETTDMEMPRHQYSSEDLNQHSESSRTERFYLSSRTSHQERNEWLNQSDLLPSLEPLSLSLDGTLSRKSKKPTKKASISDSTPTTFEGLDYPDPVPGISAKDGLQFRGNKGATEDYRPVFLGHARLYALAEKYGVETLKMLTLHRLFATLLLYKIYLRRVGDIIELIQYAYSDENTPDHEDKTDELRKLVLQYVASKVKVIGQSRRFATFLEEGGPFLRDFWPLIWKRLS